MQMLSRKLKKWAVPFLMVSLLGSALAGCSGGSADQGAKPAQPAATTKDAAKPEPAKAEAPKPTEYKIGLAIELTGPIAVWGQPMKNSVSLAVDQINGAGGIKGVPVKLVVVDSESDPAKALLAAKKLVTQDNVLAVLGGAVSPTSMAMMKFLEESKVPLVSMGSTDALIEPVAERKYIFKPVMRSQFMAEVIVQHLKQSGAKKIALLAANDAYGQSGEDALVKAVQGSGIELAIKEKFAAADKDMKPQLTRIRSQNTDAIVVWAIPPAASLINKNYKELGLKAPLIHSYGAASTFYVSLAGAENVEGTYMAMDKTWVADNLPAGDAQRKAIEVYAKGYKDGYKEDISPTGALGYDNMMLVAKALEQAGQADREALRKALENVKDFISVTGKVSMSAQDHNGHSIQDYVVAKMENGKWKIVYQPK